MKSEEGSIQIRVYRQVGSYLGIGIEFVVAILLCFFAGQWLDGKLGTEPVLMLVGAFLGAAAGFYSFIRTVLRLQEAEKRRKEGREEEKPEGAE